jgi:hypothetical protein
MVTRLRPRGFDWSSAPLHPVLVAVYPVLFLFAENAEQQVTLAPLWLPLIVCIAAGIAALLVLSGILRDWQRGALLASLLVALFFSFGHAWNLVGSVLGQRWVLAIAWGVIAIVGGVLIWRGGRWVPQAGRFLNIAAVLLVAFNIFRVAYYASESAAAAQAVAPPAEVILHAPANPPDIYYIILDRYANVDTMRSVYDFDNEPFLRELEQRGFAIARHAWANYFKTAPSVYSSLSMQHIDKAKLGETAAPYDFTSIYAALRNHLAVPTALKAIGYHYIHLGNVWEPTSTNIDADVTLRFQESAEFSGALFSTTMLSLISPPADGASTGADADSETTDRRDLTRDTTLFTFDRLAEIVDRPGPNFVFAHILLPHPPYIFKADGEFISLEQERELPERVKYVQQVMFTNKKVLAAVDRLLSDSIDPIIILQADEGPFPAAFTKDQEHFDWLKATPEEISQKFGILNAIHLPGVDSADYGFTDHTSPVNEFRIVFDAVFGADLPLLPDVTYLSPDYARMYDFVPYPHD